MFKFKLYLYFYIHIYFKDILFYYLSRYWNNNFINGLRYLPTFFRETTLKFFYIW